MRLTIATGEERLARLLWEFLYLPETLVERRGDTQEDLGWSLEVPHFLALHPRVSLVRQGLGAPRATVAIGDGPLRLLIVWANPACDGWSEIESLGTEVEGFKGELRGVTDSHIVIEELERADATRLNKRMAAFRPHLIHVLCHGALPDPEIPGSPPTPSLELHDPDGAGYAYLPATDLAGLCQVAANEGQHIQAIFIMRQCHMAFFQGRRRHMVTRVLTAPDRDLQVYHPPEHCHLAPRRVLQPQPPSTLPALHRFRSQPSFLCRFLTRCLATHRRSPPASPGVASLHS
ncbi:MAG: hypothetical protein EOM21_14595 [Gammaproteobacteria bacterium]|nr:hypothetical protein [Gammaproteobacteria bacterium]